MGLEKVESSLELSHILKQHRAHHTAMKCLLTPSQLKLCNYQLADVLCHNESEPSEWGSAVGEGAADFLTEIPLHHNVDMQLLEGVSKVHPKREFVDLNAGTGSETTIQVIKMPEPLPYGIHHDDAVQRY